MPPVGIEPTTLTREADAIAQLAKYFLEDPAAPTDWFSRWVNFLDVGKSTQVRSPQMANYP